jgi:hypothetical protein
MYSIFTILRDIRDNFTAEILQGDHIYSANSIASIETILSLFLILSIPFLTVIKNHYKAILTIFMVCFIGSVLNIACTLLYQSQLCSGVTFFLFSGLGLYCGYILINISLMDRIIGFTKTQANAGFLMYTADAAGYIASFCIMLFLIFGNFSDINWHDIFTKLLLLAGFLTACISAYSMIRIYKVNKSIE